MKYIAVFFISIYQKYISPYKGFRCAYASVYGGDSCSQAVKQIFISEGCIKGFYSSRSRFRDCRKANEERKKRWRDKKGDCIELGCETAEGCIPDKNGDSICGGCDMPSCDVPCDCSF
ncbi:MAG: membrane protein insertion efficiency factor YidD [Methylococcaceae bacterium]|nr:membrane protein insertion efficiency factor YidD [Methylococcaceae bacterium]